MLNENEIFLFNFLEIMYKMSKNEVIFFLGSGFSMNFKITNWNKFVNSLIDELKKEIEKPETNFIFNGKNTKEILEDLKIIKSKINKNLIDLSYALDMVYFCIEFNPEKIITTNDKIKALFIKEVYLKNFRINFELLDSRKTNIALLSSCIKTLKKVITTNYDNLFLYNYLNLTDEHGHFNMPYFNFQDLDYLFSKETESFYFPIHGNVLNDNFHNNNLNIWKKYSNDENLNVYQAPIIDSLSTFQKNYVEDSNFLKTFLREFLKNAMKNNVIVVFFGYSFNDYFISKEIIDVLNELSFTYGKKIHDLIYIFYDNLSDFVLNSLNILEENDLHQRPLLSYDFVKYLNFSTIFLNSKKQKEKEKFDKCINKISLIKEKFQDLDFLKKEEKQIIILKAIVSLNEFTEIKKIVYNSLIENIKNLYINYKDQIFNSKTENFLLEKYFFYIQKMLILKKTRLEIFQDIKNRFSLESENIDLYLYAFLKKCFSFSKEKDSVYFDACDLLCKKYVVRIDSNGQPIKLPEILLVLKDFLNESLLSEEKKRIILEEWS